MRRKKLVFASIAFDAKESKRSIDENGFLRVEISPFTKEQVAPYLGKEIPDFRRMGLEPEKVYHVYRPASELSKPKTVTSIQNIPIQLEHHIENPDNPPTSTRVGTTGQKAKWQAPYLSNSLTIWEARAIDLIKSGAMKELSLGYAYTPIKRAGTFQGEDYDIVMHNIRANHLALVEEGRAGHDVCVLDAKPKDLPLQEEKKPMDNELTAKLAALVAEMSNLLASSAKSPAATDEPEVQDSDDINCDGDDMNCDSEEDGALDDDTEDLDGAEEPAPDFDEEEDPNAVSDFPDDEPAEEDELSEDGDEEDLGEDEDELGEDEDELSEDEDEPEAKDEDDLDGAEDEDELSEDEDELSEDEDELSEDEDELSEDEDEPEAEDEEEPEAAEDDDEEIDIANLPPKVQALLKKAGLENASAEEIKSYINAMNEKNKELNMKVTGDSAAKVKQRAKSKGGSLVQQVAQAAKMINGSGKRNLTQDKAMKRKTAAKRKVAQDKALQRKQAAATKRKLAQDAAVKRKIAAAKRQGYEQASKNLQARYAAANATKSILGGDVMQTTFAFDSATKIYAAALKRVGVTVPSGVKLSAARTMFKAYNAGKGGKGNKGMTMDSAGRFGSSTAGSGTALGNYLKSRLAY